MNVQFPIRQADGSQYTDTDELCAALATESGGHYLLGVHGCWHGGIHISDASAPQCVQQEPVRCIADGEVVAYRLNQDYLTSTFAGTAETNTLKYSSSFCLVRHHYQSPANASEGPDQGQTNQLTFYSLYMHLAPYAAYAPSTDAGKQEDTTLLLTQPGYWQGHVEATVRHHNYARRKPDGAPAQRYGRLAVSSVLRYHTSTVRSLNVDGTNRLLAECQLISGGLWDSPLRLDGPFWTDIDDRLVTRTPVVPTEFDRVLNCQVPIKAGDPIGYLGLYESPASFAGDKDSAYQVHLEVFSCDADLDGYLKNPAGLTDGKQYLQIANGQQLYSKDGSEAVPTFTPQGRSTTEAFIIELSEASPHREASGKEWFGVTLPKGAGSLAVYVAKDDVQLITSHDREKLGFKIVREENENADGFIDPEQMPEFFRQLYRDIDAKGVANDKVSIAELQAAQGDPVLRQRWGKLIAYHPTEWQAKSDQPKWQRLHELMKDEPELLRHECERIDNLVFWNELEAAGVTLPKQIYHFHPMTFVGNMLCPSELLFGLQKTCLHPDMMEELATYIADEMNRNIQHPCVIKMKELLSYDVAEETRKQLELPWYAQVGATSPQAIGAANAAAAMTLWTERVGQGRDWDHKPKLIELFGEYPWHKQGDYEFFYDIWSNIHYGYVGVAGGLSESVLLDGAGIEQIGSDAWRFITNPKRFDGPRRTEGVEGMRAWDDMPDRVSVTIGMNLYGEFMNGGITAKIVMDKVLAVPIAEWGTGVKKHVCK